MPRLFVKKANLALVSGPCVLVRITNIRIPAEKAPDSPKDASRCRTNRISTQHGQAIAACAANAPRKTERQSAGLLPQHEPHTEPESMTSTDRSHHPSRTFRNNVAMINAAKRQSTGAEGPSGSRSNQRSRSTVSWTPRETPEFQTPYCNPTTLQPGGSGIESFRQIFLASRFEISGCLGTASAWPVWGFSQRLPSRRNMQPCHRRWRRSACCFIRLQPDPYPHRQA
jgi:hypothetical protein